MKQHMKHHHPCLATIIATIGAASAAHAALTVTPAYENAGPDGNPFLYEAKGSFSDSSYTEWNLTASVGGWSYVDLKPTANPNRGWGHTSAWYLIEIQQATQFTLSLSSADSLARPGFVLYLGESVNDVPASAHTYSNNGNDLVLLNDGWDNNGAGGAPGLSYVKHGYNATGNTLQDSVFLNPGLYTVAIGNGADSTTAPTAKSFAVTFAVPEPSSLLISLSGGLLACLRRRRH